ncbi:unnamed protein product, partial [Scytosiphon promiscuus]
MNTSLVSSSFPSRPSSIMLFREATSSFSTRSISFTTSRPLFVASLTTEGLAY